MCPRGRWRDLRRTRRLVCALALAGALVATAGCAPSKLTDTAHVTVGGQGLTVEVADSAAEQSRGLSGRPEPGDGEGMLFVWDDYGPRAFTISSVRFDLDVIYIDEDDRVSEVLSLSPDGPQDAQGSYPARYVIEVRGGWADRHGVGPCDEFEIEGGAR